LSFAKQAYASLLRGIGRAIGQKDEDLTKVPPIERRWKHWAFSLTYVYDSAGLANLDVPWWTYNAIAHIDAWLASRNGFPRVFEYGSGASTIWLARRTAEVFSVEHDRSFGEMIQHQLSAFPNVRHRIVEPVSCAHPVIGSKKEGHAGLDFAAYVASIDEVPGEFDLIVIDGRAREACLRTSLRRLATGGVIVFDNSRRRRYRAAIQASGLREQRLRGLTPTLPYPEQTSILTRPETLTSGGL
jgi:predicted O-methyltransferase YrrM